MDIGNNDDLFGSNTSKTIEKLQVHLIYTRCTQNFRLRARDTQHRHHVSGLQETLPKIDDIELIERLSEPAGIAIDNRLHRGKPARY